MAQSSLAVWYIDTHKRRFYCEYTTAIERGLSVNSHQNSHNAHWKCQMVVCFSYGITDNRRIVNFRHHGKIQQSVVLHRGQSHVSDFTEETVSVVIVVVLMETVVIRILLGDCDRSPSSIHWILVHCHWLFSFIFFQRFLFYLKHDPPKGSLFHCQHICIFQ